MSVVVTESTTEQTVAHRAAGRAVLEWKVVRRGPVNGAVLCPEVSSMPNSQWNWYASQELAGILAQDGLQCPRCRNLTRKIDAFVDEARFHCRECDSSFSPHDYHAGLRRPSNTGLSTLFRPVGERELAKIEQTGFTKFPPRLQWQPIFYPVLTQEYAEAIARDWNSTDPEHNHVGFVTRFQIKNSYLSNYEIQIAADKSALEYWIPAEDIDSFNANIVGTIEIIAEFRNGQLMTQ